MSALDRPIFLDDMISLLRRLEKRRHRQPRLAAFLFEGDRRLKLSIIHTDVIPSAMCICNAFGFYDFLKIGFVRVVRAIWSVHRMNPLPAGSEIEFFRRRGEARRPPPFFEMLRVGPCFEHKLARSIYEARDNDLAIGCR